MLSQNCWKLCPKSPALSLLVTEQHFYSWWEENRGKARSTCHFYVSKFLIYCIIFFRNLRSGFMTLAVSLSWIRDTCSESRTRTFPEQNLLFPIESHLVYPKTNLIYEQDMIL
jgi:hypothetical protein